MRSRETVVTVADYTTGTVAVTSGGTAVTGTNTVFTTTHGGGDYYMQFTGANDWYKVTARSADTAITIGTAYQGTTDLTVATYILRKIFYSLSSSADRIIDIRGWNTPCKLMQADPRTLDAMYPNPQSTNASYGFITWGVDASNNIQISPYPFPSDARLLEIRTIKRPADGTISLPAKYAHVIIWGAVAIGFGYLRKFQEAAMWNQKFEGRIKEMKKEYRLSEDSQPVLQPIDGGVRTTWQPLPDSYPTI